MVKWFGDVVVQAGEDGRARGGHGSWDDRWKVGSVDGGWVEASWGWVSVDEG